MKAISIRNLTLGDGEPKICVPVLGATEADVLAQAGAAVAEEPDLLEWRADHFAGIEDREAARAVLAGLREAVGDRPLLFTLRTEGEGGLFPADAARYRAVITWAVAQPEVDLIDIEGLREETDPALLVARAFIDGKVTIASAHFFDRTPPKSEMMDILGALDATGADMLKLAVMPDTQSDALDLMRVTADYLRESRTPLITMGMGELGAITRTTGRLTGSAVTFGAVGRGSAPGQLPVRELRELLRKI